MSCSRSRLRHLTRQSLKLGGRHVQIERRLCGFALQHAEAAGQRAPQLLHHLGLQLAVALGLRRLPLQGIDLPADFFENVEHAGEVLLRALELGFRQPLLRFELGDAGGFLDHGAPVLRLVAQDLADAALFDDGVAFGTQAGAHEQVLDVAQPGRLAVDQVFAFTRPEQAPGDRDFRLAWMFLSWPFV